MAGSRLEAAGQAADKLPAVATNCITTPCPPSCADKWRDVEAETAQAVQSPDPLVRNRKISAAYASMNIRRPDMQWIGLASIVSRQAGCAMEYADEKAQSRNPLVSDPASVAKQALAGTNKLIYQDIYPVMRFYEKHGAASLESCRLQRSDGQPVPLELRQAVRAIESGDPASASDQIAIYEQKSIVQSRVYSNEQFKATFEKNEYWAKTSIGRYFGARPAEIPLSSTCTAGKEVPFSGSIGDADDRIGYYKALKKAWYEKPAVWRYETLTEVLRQGR